MTTPRPSAGTEVRSRKRNLRYKVSLSKSSMRFVCRKWLNGQRDVLAFWLDDDRVPVSFSRRVLLHGVRDNGQASFH